MQYELWQNEIMEQMKADQIIQLPGKSAKWQKVEKLLKDEKLDLGKKPVLNITESNRCERFCQRQ